MKFIIFLLISVSLFLTINASEPRVVKQNDRGTKIKASPQPRRQKCTISCKSLVISFNFKIGTSFLQLNCNFEYS